MLLIVQYENQHIGPLLFHLVKHFPIPTRETNVFVASKITRKSRSWCKAFPARLPHSTPLPHAVSFPIRSPKSPRRSLSSQTCVEAYIECVVPGDADIITFTYFVSPIRRNDYRGVYCSETPDSAPELETQLAGLTCISTQELD